MPRGFVFLKLSRRNGTRGCLQSWGMRVQESSTGCGPSPGSHAVDVRSKSARLAGFGGCGLEKWEKQKVSVEFSVFPLCILFESVRALCEHYLQKIKRPR